MEFHDRVDVFHCLCSLVLELVDVHASDLRVIVGDGGLLHLLVCSVFLELVGLVAEVAVAEAEEAEGDVVEDLFECAGIVRLLFGGSELGVELLDFGLDDFVGDFTDHRVEEVGHSNWSRLVFVVSAEHVTSVVGKG